MPSAAIGQVDLDALAAAERAGIAVVRPAGRVEFAHPLFGSALYASLPEAERKKLHRSLADRAGDPVERARHLALAAVGPDEETAVELERAAATAAARGAADAAVELQELACRLTPETDQGARVQRSIDLSDRRYFAGDPSGARRELERLLASLPPGDDRAQVLLGLIRSCTPTRCSSWRCSRSMRGVVPITPRSRRACGCSGRPPGGS